MTLGLSKAFKRRGVVTTALLGFVPLTAHSAGVGGLRPMAGPNERSAVVYSRSDHHNWGFDPRIAPPHSVPYGRTYGEWGIKWWQWALGIPADRNPLTDTTGQFCGEEQGGRVWYLAGTFGNSADRVCVMPVGKPIFMPVMPLIFGSGVFDCHPTVPDVQCNVADLRESAAQTAEKAELLEVTIDDKPVQDVKKYRRVSPVPFRIVYPENSVTGVPAGVYYPQVSDGYWLMLRPLPVGNHIIKSRVRALGTPLGDFDFEIITRLLVLQGPHNDE